MAELRCPMCGKPNPEELEICQFCQARLKPLVIKPEEPSEDWLKPSNEDDLNNQSGLSQPEAPDWLRSLRSRNVPIEETNDEGAMSDPAEWLRAGLDDPDLLGAQRPVPQDADWLADFRSRDIDDEPAEQSLPPQEADADDRVQSDIPGELDRGVPDWLSGARINSEDDIPEPAAAEANQPDEDEEPEWLARIRASRQVDPMDQSPEVSADQSDIPDWLKAADLNLGSASQEIPLEPAPEEETPTWTSYFSRESTGEALVNEPGELKPADDEPLLPEEDLPDWLKEGSSTPEETLGIEQADEAAEPDAPADDSPPWYATTPGRPFKPTDQLSQWLRMETSEPESPEQTPEEEIPDWLKSVDDSLGNQQKPPVLDEIPDDLESVANERDEISSVPFETARRIEVPKDDSYLLSEDVHFDDEFASVEKELFSERDDETPGVLPPTVEGDLVAGNEPPWLVELRHKMDDSEEKAASKVSPFSEDIEHELPAEELAGQELPDWLIDVHAQEAIDQITEAAVPLEYEEAGTSEAGAGLAQADLPAWLEAMRPVEAVAAAASDLVDERDQSIESAGPLAGIKGVLPVEADVTAAHKSGSFGLKLQVSDMQRAACGYASGIDRERNLRKTSAT